MKRGLLLAAVAVAVLAAAPALWLVLDGSEDSRRTAALASTPEATGAAGSLVLAGINKGDPIAITTFALEIQRATGVAKPVTDRIKIVRRMDISSPAMVNMAMKGNKAATGSIELVGAGGQYATLALTNVSLVDYAHSDATELEPGLESLVLEYETIALSQQIPATIEGEIENQERIAMPGIHADAARIRATEFGVEKGAAGSGVKVAFPPLDTTLIGNARLVRGLVDLARSGGNLGEVRLHLKASTSSSGQRPDYARYEFRNALVTSLQMAPNSDGVLLTRVGLSYARVQLATFVRNADGTVANGPGYCWDLAAVAPC